MQSQHQILVYSELIDTIWLKDFDTNRCAGILRAAVYDDCLYDCGINIVKLAIYYIEAGVPYEPSCTLGSRILGYLATHQPRTLGLLDRLSALPNVQDDHVHFVIGVPEYYANLQGTNNSELDASYDKGQENDMEEISDRTGTTGSPNSHISVDTVPSDIEDTGYHNAIEAAANHLPVELFDESLARFTATCKHLRSSADAALASAVSDFVADVQSLSTTFDRVGRERSLISRLIDLVDPATSTSTTTHTIHYTSLSCRFPESANASAPLMVFVVNLDTDSESIEYDPTVSIDYAFYNAMCHFQNDWTRSNKKVKIGYSPIFGVTLVGRRLRVYGSMYYNKRVSNQLMDPYDIDTSTNVDALASIFAALRLGLTELRDWYTEVFRGCMLRGFRPAELMHTPSPHIFLDSSGKKFRFGYRRRMSSSNLHIWKGDPHSSDWPNNADSFVVKFTHKYGEDVHRLLAELGHAPKLFYCGPPYAAYPDLDVYRPLTMVIMEYFWGGSPLVYGTGVRALTKEIRDIVELLHKRGMVHGDLRGQNVMYGRDEGHIQVIYFDWAGKEGEARYPKNLSLAVKWPLGAEPGELITAAHDWYWMDEFFKPEIERRRY